MQKFDRIAQNGQTNLAMETIIKEVNLAYDVLEKGKTSGFDGALFAEEHIHSVLDLFSNKDLADALQKLVVILQSANS